MHYAARATRALKRNYPAFWREFQASGPSEYAMLAGYWNLFLKQSQKKKLRPDCAARHFVAAARPRHRTLRSCA
jgi:hypothetical protein